MRDDDDGKGVTLVWWGQGSSLSGPLTAPAIVLHHDLGVSVPHDVPPVNCVHVTKFIILLDIHAPGQNL